MTTAQANRELDGKVALVTGASRGLGLAIAEGMAAAGARVVVASRKPDACQSAAAAIVERTGGDVRPLTMHVGHWDAMEVALGVIDDWHGRLDVLVNNAGIAPVTHPLQDCTEALFDKVVEVNLKGPFRLMSLVGARMARSGGGSIINVSSIGAVRPSAPEAVYAATKSGLNTLTQAFAQAYAPAVRVNCIMPGAFATDMASSWSEEFVAAVTDRLPAGRLGRPEEIVGTAVLLASDRSSYTTGAVIPVDGGRTTLY